MLPEIAQTAIGYQTDIRLALRSASTRHADLLPFESNPGQIRQIVAYCSRTVTSAEAKMAKPITSAPLGKGEEITLPSPSAPHPSAESAR